MAETQSRYSIMDELSNRKIKIKEKINELETELDEREYQTSKNVANLKIAMKQNTYEN